MCAISNTSGGGRGKDAAPAVRIALVTLATPEIYGYAAYTAAINVASTSPHLAGAGQQLVWRAGNVATILDVLESGAGGADWIAYMDADACLVDFSAGDALVSALRQYAGEEVHLLMSRGPGSSSLFNSGFALLRNHPWTVKLVRLWWSVRIDKDNRIGDPIAGPPQEQHVIHLAGVPSEVFGRFWQGLCAAASGAEGALADEASPSSTALQASYVEHLVEQMGLFVQRRSSTAAALEEEKACGLDDEARSLDERRSCLEAAERLAFVLQRRGRTQEAVGWARRALVGRERTLGALEADGRVDEAAASAASMLRSLEGRSITYGPLHRATLLSEAKLGSLLRSLNRLDEAELHSELAASQLAKTLGAEHPTAISSAAQLAVLRVGQNRHSEASSVFSLAAKAASQGLGKDHASTLELEQQGSADALLALGRHEEAAKVARRLAKRLRRLSRRSGAAAAGSGAGNEAKPLRLRLAKALETLAWALSNSVGETSSPDAAKRFSEVERIRLEIAETYKSALGPHSPQEVSTVRSIAEAAQAQGRLDEAEGWFRRAWSAGGGRKGLLEASQPTAGRREFSLAAQLAGAMLIRARSGTARAEEAELLLRFASAGFRSASGGGGGSVSGDSSNAQEIDGKSRGPAASDGEEALPLARGAMEGLQALGPTARADVLTAESNFALHATNRQPESEAMYRQVLAGNEEAHFGAASQEASATRADLAELLRRLGQRTAAEAWNDAAKDGVGPAPGEYNYEKTTRTGKITPFKWNMQGKTEPLEKPRGERRYARPGPGQYPTPAYGSRNEFCSQEKPAQWKFTQDVRGLL
ncbi:unnamed protein product [Polarella glacialis]|uniref:Uncharacterized protein n=1 Tax=Polarella glacialis TaxID=89957 RepID=A0A813H9X4_POLGL|nr:unnamed protein product [Polarella glacialis]